MLRAAGERFVRAAIPITGQLFAGDVFDAVNRVASMHYEKRVGAGRIIIVRSDHPGLVTTFSYAKPVSLNEPRSFRKLLEMSGERALALLSDGANVYGVGSFLPVDSNVEDAFLIRVEGLGVWTFGLPGRPLLQVENGIPHLPQARMSRRRFDDLAHRILGEQADVDRLWQLAEHASAAEHGTMVVVSNDAAGEARRLASQAHLINPVELGADAVAAGSAIDGAILADPSGLTHALGVILDGTADNKTGDPGRGARLNSALRYLRTTTHETLIVLVSEDGMINLLPDLRPRISHSQIPDLISEMQRVTDCADDELDRHDFYKLWHRIEALAFYLSEADCLTINSMRARVDKIPPKIWNEVQLVRGDFRPHEDMDETYFIPEEAAVN